MSKERRWGLENSEVPNCDTCMHVPKQSKFYKEIQKKKSIENLSKSMCVLKLPLSQTLISTVNPVMHSNNHFLEKF